MQKWQKLNIYCRDYQDKSKIQVWCEASWKLSLPIFVANSVRRDKVLKPY